MISIIRDRSDGVNDIKSYAPGNIQIDDATYTTSIIVSATKIMSPWGPKHLDDLNANTLAPLFEFEPEVVILGVGATMAIPSHGVLGEFHGRKIGIEFMDTGAACRTYNVLVAEGRNVVAGLLID